MINKPKSNIPDCIICPKCVGWGTSIIIDIDKVYFTIEKCEKCTGTGRKIIPKTEIN